MKTSKLVLPLLVALAYAPVQVLAGTTTVLGSELSSLTIFADTYTGEGATTSTTDLHAIVFGSILAGGVVSMGSNSTVWGNVSTPEAMSIGGNNAHLSGSIQSGGVLSLGDSAKVDGNITSSGTSSVGANATVGGDVLAGGVTSLGANAKVAGSVASGGTASLGDHAAVGKNLSALGAISLGNGTVGGTVTKLTANPIDPATMSPFDPVAYKAGLVNRVATDSALVTAAQSALRNMTAASATSLGLNFYGGTVASALAATLTVNTTLNSGVYSAASLSTTDLGPGVGMKLILDGQNKTDAAWVFNISTILAFGANTIVELINAPGTPSVIWNAYNGYVSTGDGSTVIGTILAKTYVMVGANAFVDGVNNSVGGKLACGGVYSATSYVSTGDSAVVDGRGCIAKVADTTTAAVPEPGSLAMLLTGLGLLGFMVRRKKAL